MNQVWGSKVPLYFETEESQLVLGDSFKILTKMKQESVDMIFADPPYFLSNDGITCQGGKMVSVNKGSWDKLSESGTSVEEKHKFNRKWIRLCKKVLKPNGTIWISGTLHNIYSIGMALEQEGFKIINNITWQKTNPPPNLACRCFTHSTETILWAKKNDKKSRHFFDYQKMKKMNGGKQMKDVWTGALTKPSEKTEGKHPTQKPEYLLEKIVLASTEKGQVILDPFCGSGTTGVEAVRFGRKFVGIDVSEEYLEISKRRLEKVKIDANMYMKRLKAYKQIGYEIAGGLHNDKQTANAIYDGDNYAENYHKDLLDANKNIIISSPAISGTKVYELINLLKEKQLSGVQITIVTWAPDSYGFGDASYWMQLHEEMRKAGFYIKTVEESCERFAVIDQEVVWYGNINLLAKDKVDDSIMRVLSKEIASELMEITFGDNG